MKYTVVIPTRDRFHYLNSAIESCLVTGRADIEVIVSINTTQTWDKIALIYTTLDSPQVRYVLTGRNLSMHENYNFGIAQARGQYVTVMGDDDALLPSAFNYADLFFLEHPTVPLSWFRRPYLWPDYIQQPFSDLAPNTLHCWTEKSLKVYETKPLLELVSTTYVPYHNLPSLYNSFYPRNLIALFRQAQAQIEGSHAPKSIFLSDAFAPDVFSAYAALVLTKCYGLISVPLSLSGISSRSSGMGALQKCKGVDFMNYMSDFSNETIKRIQSGPFGSYDYLYAQICNDACRVLLSFGQLPEISLPMPQVDLIANALIDVYAKQHYITQPWAVFEMLKLAHDFGCKDGFTRLMPIAAWYLQNYNDELALWLSRQVDPPKIHGQGSSYTVVNCNYFDVSTAVQAANLYQLFLDNQIQGLV